MLQLAAPSATKPCALRTCLAPIRRVERSRERSRRDRVSRPAKEWSRKTLIPPGIQGCPATPGESVAWFTVGTALTFSQIRMPVVTVNALSISTLFRSPRVSFGVMVPLPMTRSILICGRATLSQPEPPQFDQPWQAQALALSMALMQAGCFSAAEWAASLGSAIRQAQAAGDPDDGSTYYNHVLEALEQLVFQKSIATADVLAARKEAWQAAYARTPHGRPVLLD